MSLTKSMKIWVTGASGQLGSELSELSKNLDHVFLFTDREVDLTDQSKVNETFDTFQPDCVINCAAYTAVDKAEEEVELCKKVNKDAAAYLATACKKQDCMLIHFSSDYIYHIDTDVPLVETDIPEPKGRYAIDKLAGERQIQKLMADNYIIMRTSWVYSSFGNNFVKTMIRLGRDREELSIVKDQIGAPTYARDLAKLCFTLISKLSEDKVKYSGIYNYSNLGKISWCDFASKIFELENITCKINPITTAEFGAKAPRPAWSVLNTSKIQQNLNVTIPNWEDSLRHCLNQLAIK